MNQIAKSGNTINEVAAAEIASGTFDFTASGIAKFYGANGQDSQAVQAGAETSPYVANVSVWINKANVGDVFVQGAEVRGDVSNQNAVASGGDGRLGYAEEPSSNTDTRVLVRWNG